MSDAEESNVCFKMAKFKDDLQKEAIVFVQKNLIELTHEFV